MKSFKVICEDTTGVEHAVNVMATDIVAAMNAAIYSLREGSNLSATATKAYSIKSI